MLPEGQVFLGLELSTFILCTNKGQCQHSGLRKIKENELV